MGKLVSGSTLSRPRYNSIVIGACLMVSEVGKLLPELQIRISAARITYALLHQLRLISAPLLPA